MRQKLSIIEIDKFFKKFKKVFGTSFVFGIMSIGICLVSVKESEKFRNA